IFPQQRLWYYCNEVQACQLLFGNRPLAADARVLLNNRGIQIWLWISQFISGESRDSLFELVSITARLRVATRRLFDVRACI
ncbi:MAG: hypothetical protein ABLQ96_06355, partial [Candidatus Acidiferrum sp.]